MRRMISPRFPTCFVLPALLTALLSMSACASIPVYPGPPPPTPTLIPGEHIPFEVVTDAWPYVHCEKSPDAFAHFASTPEEYAQFPDYTSSDGPKRPKWEALNLQDEAVIGIWRCSGPCDTGINVATIVQTQKNALTLYIESGVRAPRPDLVCPTDSPTFFQLVRIPWDGTPASETTLNLVLYTVYK